MPVAKTSKKFQELDGGWTYRRTYVQTENRAQNGEKTLQNWHLSIDQMYDRPFSLTDIKSLNFSPHVFFSHHNLPKFTKVILCISPTEFITFNSFLDKLKIARKIIKLKKVYQIVCKQKKKLSEEQQNLGSEYPHANNFVLLEFLCLAKKSLILLFY